MNEENLAVKSKKRNKDLNEERKNPWLALLAIILGSIMVSLDSTIVSVANPVIAVKLHASQGDLQWITNGYLLTLGTFMIISAKLGDKYGRKQMFIIGVLGFALSSLAIGLSASTILVITFRAIQGIFGALIMTNSLALIRTGLPIEKLTTGISIFSSANGLSLALGPILGGLIVGYLNWEWAFFINVIIGLICLILGLNLIPRSKSDINLQFDAGGIIAMGGFLLALTYALINGPIDGWTSHKIMLLIWAAIICLIAFIIIEKKVKEPSIPLSLFCNPSISAGLVMTTLFMFAMNGALFYVMLYTEQIQGIDPLMAGVRLLPLGISLLVSAVISEPIIKIIKPKFSLVIGMLIMAAGLFIATFTTVNDNYLVIGISLAVLGVGLGLVIPASTDAIIGNASIEHAGAASGVMNTAQRIGGLLGIAVLGAVMAKNTTTQFHDSLVNANLPNSLVDSLSQANQVTATVTQGIAPIPPNSSETVINAINNATSASFISGMHSAMLAGAIICIAGAIASLLVSNDTPVGVEEEV